jgi:hypothetical protein
MVTSEDIFGDDETQATPVPVSIDSDDEEIVHDDAEGGPSVKRAKTSREWLTTHQKLKAVQHYEKTNES